MELNTDPIKNASAIDRQFHKLDHLIEQGV